MLLAGDQKGYIILNLHHYILCSCITFKYKIRIQFNKNVLVVEQNNYTTKFANAYTAYDLHDWPKISLNNFKLLAWCN